VETRTAGSASGLGKRTSSNAGTAPQADSSVSARHPVDMISVRHQIAGSAAYAVLRQAADGTNLSVREMARVVIQAPGPLDQGKA
jgi:hypothetical protein